MMHSIFFTNSFNRLLKWPWLCLLLTLLFVRVSLGVDSGYTNSTLVYFDGILGDTRPSGFNPQINATNFVNTGQFLIYNGSTYQTWYTTNFINTGLMQGIDGFWFDRHTTGQIPDAWASGFYNSDEIDSEYSLTVWATNIMIPGTVTVASSLLGQMELTGKSVDLTRTTISMAGGAQSGGTIFGINPTVGLVTNAWTPANNLALPDPITPFFIVPPMLFLQQLQLINPVVYANDTGIINSNRVVQVVYISQPNPAIANNVTFDPTPNTGGITVQFSGTYVDPSTGQSATNYLVIFDNFGERTNLAVGGIAPQSFPVNYTIYEANSPAIPVVPQQSFLPAGIYGNTVLKSNAYAYVQADMASTTVSTNNIANGAITNLPARVRINAASDLDLTLADVGGANYLSLTCTNQFAGNSGAQIVAPFADISLGVTNGYLTTSNLLAADTPVWDGTVILWSARWSYLQTNFVGTNATVITNSFHVLFVDSPTLSAVSRAQVQNLSLHATNSLVISDAFNIMSSLFIDAQSLTLTTNGYGNGAGSVDGELNLNANSILWQSSLPNLLWLTNYGVITTASLANFGSSTQPYGAFINYGLVSNEGGATIWANNFNNSGIFSSGLDSFVLQALTTTLTNGSVTAGGNISITTGSLVTSNLALSAGQSLTLQATNQLTDSGVTNGNSWFVGGAGLGIGSSLFGLNLPLRPSSGDLLGTTILMTSPSPNKQVVSTWASTNLGASVTGFTNNVAVGHLILDGLGIASSFKFTGTGASNAMYVDLLELRDQATNRDVNGNFLAISNTPNMVIYFASAFMNGVSVADKMNGKNGNRLIWIPAYTGYFSSTNYVNFDGTTNVVNTSVLQSTTIDSDGDGIPNASDPTPFFTTSEFDFTMSQTNLPPLAALIQWHSIPSATNYIFYSTNGLTGQYNLLLTNFVSPSLVPPAGGWPITNAVVDPNGSGRYYKLRLDYKYNYN